MTTQKPEPGSPEFEAWLNEQAQKWSKELFDKEKPDDIAELEKGIIAGPNIFKDIMPEKTISEDIAIDKTDNVKRLAEAKQKKGWTQKEIDKFAKRRAKELQEVSENTLEPDYLSSGTQKPSRKSVIMTKKTTNPLNQLEKQKTSGLSQ